MTIRIKLIALFVLTLSGGLALRPQPHNVNSATTPRAFLEAHCVACHNSTNQKAGLDLTALRDDYTGAATFATWVKVHDRVYEHEMPPKNAPQPEANARAAFLKQLAQPMIADDAARIRREGRAIWRRMNRYEYENTLRDLLGAPWLQVKELLPEDGEAFRFDAVVAVSLQEEM